MPRGYEILSEIKAINVSLEQVLLSDNDSASSQPAKKGIVSACVKTSSCANKNVGKNKTRKK